MFVGVVTQDYVNIVCVVVVLINKNKHMYTVSLIETSNVTWISGFKIGIL